MEGGDATFQEIHMSNSNFGLSFLAYYNVGHLPFRKLNCEVITWTNHQDKYFQQRSESRIQSWANICLFNMEECKWTTCLNSIIILRTIVSDRLKKYRRHYTINISFFFYQNSEQQNYFSLGNFNGSIFSQCSVQLEWALGKYFFYCAWSLSCH